MLKLDEYQQKVINLHHGRHTVFASAGSGKTEVLTRRINEALLQGIDPKKMLCLTFTNRAALNMKERAYTTIGDKIADIFIGNTHSLGINLSYKYKHLNPNITLTTEDIINDIWKLSEENITAEFEHFFDKISFNQDTIENSSSSHSVISYMSESINLVALKNIFHIKPLNNKNFLFEIINASNNNVNIKKDLQGLYFTLSSIDCCLKSTTLDKNLIAKYIAQMVKSTKNNYESEMFSNTVSFETLFYLAIQVGEKYEKLKRKLQVIDFDDLLKSLLEIPSQKYQWIQVDEVQDMSAIQWLILEHHSAPNAHQVYFGDINQSIYDFLGADVNYTRNSVSNIIHELPVNYRSPKAMVDLFSKYMKVNFPANDQFTVTTPNIDNSHSLVHLHGDNPFNLKKYLIKYCKNLNDKNKTIAILCPSNKGVNDYSKSLTDENITHFRVSQFDLFSKKASLDFTSLIRAINNNQDFSAWGRMLWNLAITTNKEPKNNTIPPQLYALEIAANLTNRYVYLSDFINSTNIYDHALSKLLSLKDTGYVYFDTETTGLNVNDSTIIQIAAVKIMPDGTKQELDLYCQSDKPVGDSFNIHNITNKKLDEIGKPLVEQLSKFIEFIDGLPIVAHNLNFDEKMIIAALHKEQPEAIVNIQNIKKYCSLDMSRRLFPDLQSYKLGDLLSYFDLEGENSHNAIDDVRAGVNLMEHLINKASTVINYADDYINENESILLNFHKNINILYAYIQPTLKSNTPSLNDLFTYFIEYVKTSRRSMMNNDEYTYIETIEELETKLYRWLTSLNIIGKDQSLIATLAKKFISLKEVDLITKEDKIIVSTIHRSKGLEFEYVLLPDITDNAFPCYPVKKMKDSPKKQLALEEQKRLLYVAMTRAKKQLVIGSYNRNDWNYKALPSRFIAPLLNDFNTHIIKLA